MRSGSLLIQETGRLARARAERAAGDLTRRGRGSGASRVREPPLPSARREARCGQWKARSGVWRGEEEGEKAGGSKLKRFVRGMMYPSLSWKHNMLGGIEHVFRSTLD
uniref:Uncharacterized protein n=1 Tax=Oryza punctata TaxID=4537 RepID=A0A0E0LNB7_ORYPU